MSSYNSKNTIYKRVHDLEQIVSQQAEIITMLMSKLDVSLNNVNDFLDYDETDMAILDRCIGMQMLYVDISHNQKLQLLRGEEVSVGNLLISFTNSSILKDLTVVNKKFPLLNEYHVHNPQADPCRVRNTVEVMYGYC